mgnify:FL=1
MFNRLSFFEVFLIFWYIYQLNVEDDTNHICITHSSNALFGSAGSSHVQLELHKYDGDPYICYLWFPAAMVWGSSIGVSCVHKSQDPICMYLYF